MRVKHGEQEDFHHIGLIYEVEVRGQSTVPTAGDEQPEWFALVEVSLLALTPFAAALLNHANE